MSALNLTSRAGGWKTAALWGCLPIAMAAFALPFIAAAQSNSANFELSRQTIDGGGGRATSSGYRLTGTVGQPDAGETMISASFTLTGGFQRRLPPDARSELVFKDSFESP